MRVGFVIDSCVPSMENVLGFRCSPRVLVSGWPSGSSVATMRFGWIADAVSGNGQVRYELYRPSRTYDCVVFLKSMGPQSLALARKLKSRGVTTVFDCNVDYVTPASGTFYFDGMAPTVAQREDALQMLETCDSVIADSSHIAGVLSNKGATVHWVPDNVLDAMIGRRAKGPFDEHGRLVLAWSGEAVKLFELLAIREVLESFGDRVVLRMITNSRDALSRWTGDLAEQFEDMLRVVPHEYIPFTTLSDLLDVYARGGVAISPRFLDNTYNLGHTEWKLTLPMSVGLVALGSPQPSYVDVEKRCQAGGLRVCETAEDWSGAFQQIIDDSCDLSAASQDAVDVVTGFYSTSVVAKQHQDFLMATGATS